MSGVWDDRKKALEEDYFRRKEQEAIEKLRAQRAAEEQAAQMQASALHCPRCDGTLEEITYEEVLIDRCNKCNGIWLDAGELERLTEQEGGGGVLGRWWKTLSGKE
jgi:Zn-finger nucleic acid-binding protein